MSDESLDTPAPASLTDRIAARFGGLPKAEEPATEPVTEATDAPQFADLEWDGKTYQVPVALKDAFMREQDYTKKTTELSEQRKAIDVVRETLENAQKTAAFNDSVAPERQELAIIDAYVSRARQIDTSQMSMEQIFRHKMEMDQIMERRTSIKEAIDAKRTKFDEEMNTNLARLKGQAREVAAKKLGEFSEETEKSIRQWAVAEGFTESEADRVMLHPLSAVTMWKAMQYDKVKAGTGKVQTATKALKPGNAGERMPQEARNRLEFGKAMKAAQTSGEKARVIEERLATGLFAKGHT